MTSSIPNWLDVASSCYSSYRQNDLGWVLYGLVRAYKPEVCIELGVLEGYSAIFTAAALRDNQLGRLYAYDLWEDYPYRHTTQAETQARLETAGLQWAVEFFKYDAYDVPNLVEWGTKVDFLHVDLSNDGNTFVWVMNAFRPCLSEKGIVVFEGGSKERDQCDWMLQYDKPPIRDVLENETVMKDWDWFVIEPYPSMTVMRPK